MAAYRPKKIPAALNIENLGDAEFLIPGTVFDSQATGVWKEIKAIIFTPKDLFPQWPNVLSHQFQILIYLNPMQMALSDHLQRCGGVVGTQGQGGPRTPSSKTFSSQTEGQLRVPKPNKNPY